MIGIAVIYLLLWGLALYAVLLKLYLERSRGHFGSQQRLDGKVALVTGATQGIGVEVARDLLRRGCRVWIACRDARRGAFMAEQLLDSIRDCKQINNEQSTQTDCDIVNSLVEADLPAQPVMCRSLHMDLCSFQSVRRAVRQLAEEETHLDIIINNAAIIAESTDTFTEDGYEATYQTNYLSPIYLVVLLVELLRKAPAARVVNVSSNLHHVGLSRSVMEDATRESRWWESPIQLYANSKFALNMASLELAYLLREEGITVNTVHPGATRTQISFHGSTSMAVFFFFVYQLFGKTPAEAAETISYAAVCPSLDKVTGRHLVDCGLGWNNWRVYNRQRRQSLLKETCQLLNLPNLYK